MLSCTIAHLVKLNALIQLLMQTFAGSTIRWMKCSIIAICTAATAYFAITIRARKTCVQNYFLEALTIPTLEIADKGVVSLAVRKSVLVKINIHWQQN